MLPKKLESRLSRVLCPQHGEIFLVQCKSCADHMGMGKQGKRVLVDCPNVPPTKPVEARAL